jgi:hypothetical protein
MVRLLSERAHTPAWSRPEVRCLMASHTSEEPPPMPPRALPDPTDWRSPGRATGDDAEILDEDAYLGYDAEEFPYT